MKILIVTDTWKPQVNGVVRTLKELISRMESRGHAVRVVGPDLKSPYAFPVPFYKDIVLEFLSAPRLWKLLHDDPPDAVHIATEGPLGWAMRNLCLKQGRPFTTSFHTRFPDYLSRRVPDFLAPHVARATFEILKRFHAPSSGVMVATRSLAKELKKRGFPRLIECPYGVDTSLFKPQTEKPRMYETLPRPVMLYVGRIAAEKNLRAFLDLESFGSKVVIGDGPELSSLYRDYPGVHFLGPMRGEELARHYAAADVFVFPSKTDTFGLVLLEACASGLKVAAYNVAGPADILGGSAGAAFAALDESLQRAVDRALILPDAPEAARAHAEKYSWDACTERFLAALKPRLAERASSGV
ncbi:MAG: glycosyltransferase family 1 protein [Alphaproteobacteria bacterium]|nr:glycosyltransferase family 1 protein [Alphaproteobacteria bacterium]